MRVLASTIIKYVEIPESTLERWLELSPTQLIDDPEYLKTVATLDRRTLMGTMPRVLASYGILLPRYQIELFDKYNITSAPMFSDSMTRWILSVLESPHFMGQILEIHRDIPTEVFLEGIPVILEVLDKVHYGGKAWQEAICLLCLPLIADPKGATTAANR